MTTTITVKIVFHHLERKMVGLPSHLSHNPVLNDLSRSQSLRPKCREYHVPVQVPLVVVFYRPGHGDWSWWKEREKKRESSISQVTWKINEAHAQEYHSRRHRASSQGGLESPGKNVSSVGFHAPKRMKTKRGTWGTQVSSGARVFY